MKALNLSVKHDDPVFLNHMHIHETQFTNDCNRYTGLSKRNGTRLRESSALLRLTGA